MIITSIITIMSNALLVHLVVDPFDCSVLSLDKGYLITDGFLYLVLTTTSSIIIWLVKSDYLQKNIRQYLQWTR